MRKSNLALLALAILAVEAQHPRPQQQGLPVVYFHGLGSSCLLEEPGLFFKQLKNSPFNNSIHCVEYAPGSATWMEGMMAQSEKACKIVMKNFQKWQLFNGFILLGASQGSLIARFILQECQAGAYAKRLITIGGPHMGVTRLPHTSYKSVEKFLNNIVDDFVYMPMIQAHIGPAGYFRTSRRYKKYLENSSFLRYMNNEYQFNPKYKARIMQLDKFVMIAFTKDTMVFPYQSEQFGEFSDASQTLTISMRDTNIYRNDLLGLMHLDNTNRIIFYESPTNHLQLNKAQIDEFIVANLGVF